MGWGHVIPQKKFGVLGKVDPRVTETTDNLVGHFHLNGGTWPWRGKVAESDLLGLSWFW